MEFGFVYLYTSHFVFWVWRAGAQLWHPISTYTVLFVSPKLRASALEFTMALCSYLALSGCFWLSSGHDVVSFPCGHHAEYYR